MRQNLRQFGTQFLGGADTAKRGRECVIFLIVLPDRLDINTDFSVLGIRQENVEAALGKDRLKGCKHLAISCVGAGYR